MDYDNLDYYAAGLIDGEGTITLSFREHPEFRQPVVSMSSTTRELLDFMVERYGGHISTHKIYEEHYKQSFSWKVCQNRAVQFCERIYPLLKEPAKHRRAKLIATEYKFVTSRNGKYTDQQRQAKLAFQDRFFHPSTP